MACRSRLRSSSEPEQLNRTIFTPPFTLAQVNAQVGPGYDNIVSLRGINY